MEVSYNGGTPIAGWFTMENPVKIHDLGVPPFQEAYHLRPPSSRRSRAAPDNTLASAEPPDNSWANVWTLKKTPPIWIDIHIYIYTYVVGVKYIDTPIMEDIYIYPIYHGSWMINYCLADAWECERNGWECGNWSFFCAVSLIMVHRQISSLNEAQLYCWSSIYT